MASARPKPTLPDKPFPDSSALSPAAPNPPLDIAVTGGTGFIGRNLISALLAKKCHVTALTRGKKPLQHARLTWIQGSLESIDALEELLSGASHLVHLAGRVGGNTRREFQRDNAEAMARLVTLCEGAPHPPKFLYLSSLAAREPELSDYASSKHLAERVLSKALSGLEWTVFRPPAVYGPGDTQVRSLLRLASNGLFIAPASLDHRLSLIHVSDLVGAILAWINSADTQGETFELSDPTIGGYTWRQVVQILGKHYARSVRPVKVPRTLLSLVGSINLGWGRLIGRPTFLSPGKAREYSHADWVADAGPARQALKWQPQIPLAQGLRELD